MGIISQSRQRYSLCRSILTRRHVTLSILSGFLLTLLLSPTDGCTAENVSNQATAEAVVVNGFVVGINVTFGGDGYFTPPPVTIVGTGTNAQAIANVQGGKVVAVNVTDAGAGYSTNTQVEIGPSSYPDVTDIQLFVGMKLVGQVGSLIELQTAPSLEDPFPWFHLTVVTQTVNPQNFFDPLAPGKNFYRALPIPTNPNPAQLVWIPPGTFTMGSPATEPGRNPDEQQHIVSVTQGFWIGQHEVTQDEYMRTMLATPGVFAGDPNLPVENVTWQDAINYCEALSRREQDAGRLPNGFVYRLPTEAEWEYAARGGSTQAYFFGNDSQVLPQFAWFVTNSSSQTQPIATKTTNPWGLFDVYGNVAEWCSDWYGPLAPDRAFDPQGPTTGTNRVVRGGSWGSTAEECRSGSRASLSPTNSDSSVGFRVVLAKGNFIWPTNPNPAQLVWIPPGSFLMGSPAGEAGRGADEQQHQVTITRGFWIAKYELTEAEYAELTGVSVVTPNGAKALNWASASQYCQLLSQHEQQLGRLPAGYVYRMPTEAEWEYVARDGTETRFFFGDDTFYTQLGNYAWYGLSSPGAWKPVGQKNPDGVGIFDIYGNLNEWCSDWYGPYPSTSVVDPKGPATGQLRVYRGGGVYSDGATCRSAWRGNQSSSIWPTGLRVVLGNP